MLTLLSKMRGWLEKRSPAQAITGYYLFAVTISIGLFSLPGVYRRGTEVSFFDTVFTAVSVVSDTGLAVLNVADTFSVFGYFIIMLVLQFGGLGIMAMSTFFWILIGRKIGLRERQLIMVDNNQFQLSGLVQFIKEILGIILLAEFIGAVIFGLHFLNYFPTWQEAFLQGLFASVSATTNAGMDITGQSLMPFAHDYFVQIVTSFLIIFGAIGFPVLIEIKTFLARRRDKQAQPFRFSLFAKLTTSTYVILLVVGTILIFLLEYQHYFKGMSWHEGFFYSFFQTTSTRSAGLTTMDITQMSESTLLVMSIYMFIGGSPNSVGGGIRTTTFAVCTLFVYNYVRGNREIKVFNREIHPDDVMKSLAIMLLAIMMCGTSVIVINITDPHHQLISIILEVCSAFGTVGMSTGITPELSAFAKCLLMLLMFIGRIGLTSFIFIIGGKKKKPKIHFPVERVISG